MVAQRKLSLSRVLVALAASGIAAGQETISIDWVVKTYDDMNASVGDTVEFTWPPDKHNLYIHPSGTCDEEGRELVGDDASGFGSYQFTATDAAAGTVTFSCDIYGGAHCRNGQIVTFNVVDGGEASSEEAATTAATEAATTDEKVDEEAAETTETATESTDPPAEAVTTESPAEYKDETVEGLAPVEAEENKEREEENKENEEESSAKAASLGSAGILAGVAVLMA